MLQLLYGAIFGEIFMILSFLFKTPFRKLVIITLDRVKRGRGPAVVKTVAATLLLLLASSIHSVFKIRRRNFEAGGGGGIVNPTDQVLMSNHVLEASLLGFVLFLSLMIDRLHHYIRELRLLRRAVESAKKQSRSFGDGINGIATEQNKALMEEIATLRSKVKELESACEVKGSRAQGLEAEVETLKKQSEGFLLEYDRLLADNQNLRSQLEGI